LPASPTATAARMIASFSALTGDGFNHATGDPDRRPWTNAVAVLRRAWPTIDQKTISAGRHVALDRYERSYYYHLMTKGEDTKRAILERASQLASRIGLEAVTIGRLASELGLSKSGLFAHFGAKEALQVQMLEYTAEDYREVVVRPAFREAAGVPRLQALFDNWLKWVKANGLEGGCLFVQAATELDDQPGAPRDSMETWQRMWLESLAEAARRAIDVGHFRADLNCDQFAFEFNAILFGYHNSQRMLKDPRSEDFARAAIDELLAKSGR